VLLVIQYRMLVFPRLKLSGGGSTTANCWLSIGGQYGETEQIQLPKHTLDITIKVVSSVCQLYCQCVRSESLLADSLAISGIT